ncbi:MAG TPA: DHA2 family efflux MFS transporter permease subunit [Kofleriaceae bacterium]|nr:DHA2 family efflux MFS transporter permease subunit [Kofleriaceae bacterium]
MSSVAAPREAASGWNVSGADRLLITFAVMSATLLQVLDTTIVNVALPHMQGSLGASSDQISWVLTSYLVSSAICMPLTGYLSDVLGRKRFLVIGIAGFVTASALCGLSQSLAEIVVFRLLQGIFGSALVPLSQAIMAEAYPPSERGRAMALWGLGVMVGPVLGPTLGGWLTEVASWRWTFYINVPVGALSLLLAMQFVPDTPRRPRRMDWASFTLLSAGIAGVQYFLDRGNQRDWLGAGDIRIALGLGLVGLVAFVWYSVKYPGRAVLDVRIFTDRNFAMACVLILALGLGMFGALVIQPILLERLLEYPIMTTGLIMAPRGIATAITMIVVGRLVARIDARLLIGTGILVSAVATHAMTAYSLDVDKFWLIWPIFVQGIGLGLIFVPLSTTAYATLERSRLAEAAGIYSLVRTIGAAIGISVATTVMTRQGQILWNALGGRVNVYNPAFHEFLKPLGLSPTDPLAAAVAAQEIARQAEMIAIIDVFALITWSILAMAPLVLLMRSSRHGEGAYQAPSSQPVSHVKSS